MAKLKEYRYLYSISSYIFDIACHLLCVAVSDSVPNHVQSALLTILCLVSAVYELAERRRQSLPLLTG